MKKRLRVYLSGGMEYAKNEGADWRSDMDSWIQINLGHIVFNPNHQSQKYLSKHLPDADLRKLKTTDIEKFIRIVHGIVDFDSHEIAERSDYVVCYWDRGAAQGAGTKGELTIAKFFKKSVYMVTRIKKENIPGWVLGCTTEFFSNWSDLKIFLLERFYSE